VHGFKIPNTGERQKMAQDETASPAEAQADPEAHSQVQAPAPRQLTPEAERALAEAEARRRAAAMSAAAPSEVGGRNGPDPVRYGDWEKGGIASDF
jgi:hypothetical protein